MSHQSAITAPGGTSIVYGTHGAPIATTEQLAVRLPCLPGCDDTHQYPISECHAVNNIGTVSVSYSPPLTIRSYSRTEGALRTAEVGLAFEGDHPDNERSLNPDVARRLAMYLLDAADTAERVAAGIPASPTQTHLTLVKA